MYGIEFWGIAADYLIKRVFKLQKQAIRILAGVGPIESCRNLFRPLEILTLPALYLCQILIFLIKKHPHYLEHTKPNHSYETRHKNNYIFTKHKTHSFEKGALYASQIFYSKLPENKKNIALLDRFKIKLLLGLTLYCVDDFFNADICK